MDNIITLPLIPLRGLTIFPNMVMHFDIGREKSKGAVNIAMENGGDIFVSPQKDIEIEEPKKNDVCKIGTICTIKQVIKMPNDIVRILIEGKEKGKILKYKTKKEYIQVEVERIKEEEMLDKEGEAYLRTLKEGFIKYMKLIGNGTINPDMAKGIEIDDNPFQIADVIAGIVVAKEDERREVLEILDIKKKLKRLLNIITEEIEILKIQSKISKKVKSNMDEAQKEYFLREQIKVIQEELNEGDENEAEIKRIEEKLETLDLPEEVLEKVNYEIKRLRSMNSNSSESNVVKTYLEWILDIPWNQFAEDNLDIKLSEEIINRDHYGLEKVKERIIEFLAVKQVSGTMRGPILCLVGPPGVGKTSIVKSIADSMNRKYTRIALGGMKDESEIRGHRKTYVGAIPGRIAYALKDAKSMNPVMLLDEIDKISSNFKGDPSDALLEVLDGEQNKAFRDAYLEIPIDLSNVFFIATANSLETVPRPLLDRMEIIEVSGYTYEEKFEIAKRYLVPKQLKEHNVTKKEIKISDDAINEIINCYTRESGVRGLNRKIGSLVRKGLTEMIKNDKKSVSINKKKAEELLGNNKLTQDFVDGIDKIGVVTGMAWTAYGGDTLPVEAIAMTGTGKLQLTGQLGDVMQESAKAAFTYVRANAKKYEIDEEFYKNKDIHIHVPEGAVPKDGPSAGVTMVTALVSALSNKKVRCNVAMTGEVTLTGRVLPIGGLREKALAASRFGITKIIIPKDNEKDIIDIPKNIREKLEILPVSNVETVIENAIIGDDK